MLADFFLHGLDLVLHGVELLVRLHRHDLLFVLFEPLLGGQQVLVDGASGGLVVFEGLLRGGKGGRGRLQDGVERGDAAGSLGDGLVGHRGLAFDALEFDEPLKIWEH